MCRLTRDPPLTLDYRASERTIFSPTPPPKGTTIRLGDVVLEAMDALLTLLPEIESWQGPFGAWEQPPSSSDGVVHFAFFAEDERIERYRAALTHAFWDVRDHPDYRLQETYNSLAAGASVTHANLEQVRFMLFATVCVERWVDGGLAGLFEAGRIAPVVRRLQELRERYPRDCSAEEHLSAWVASARSDLVRACLNWEGVLGIAPAITSRLSELDAAVLVGCPLPKLRKQWTSSTAVTKGTDFVKDGIRYQVKANRPSGKPGSLVTLVAKPKNTDWDILIWILYDREYQIQEAWRWSVAAYKEKLEALPHIRPKHLRLGDRLFPRE